MQHHIISYNAKSYKQQVYIRHRARMGTSGVFLGQELICRLLIWVLLPCWLQVCCLAGLLVAGLG